MMSFAEQRATNGSRNKREQKGWSLLRIGNLANPKRWSFWVAP